MATRKEATEIRRMYKRQHPLCQMPRCGHEACDLHEMARGAHRHAAIDQPCTFLHLCRLHHDAVHDTSRWSLAKQLAVKLIADPDNFNLLAFNRLRSRADAAIELSEVLVWTKHFRVKVNYGIDR